MKLACNNLKSYYCNQLLEKTVLDSMFFVFLVLFCLLLRSHLLVLLQDARLVLAFRRFQKVWKLESFSSRQIDMSFMVRIHELPFKTSFSPGCRIFVLFIPHSC